MQSAKTQFGLQGEAFAAQVLSAQGYKILARNFSCRMGEVDIIARHGEYIVFIEVRTRSPQHFGTPAETVNYAKQRKLVRTAQYYLQTHAQGLQPRFDVFAIVTQPDFLNPTYEHIQDAFYGE